MPVPVVVPLALFVVVPFAVVVPPFGPVTMPDSLVPVRVRVTLPCPDAVLPRAPVTLPLPFTVFAEREAVPVAEEPRGPVRVFCAIAGSARRKDSAESATNLFDMRITFRKVFRLGLNGSLDQTRFVYEPSCFTTLPYIRGEGAIR